MEDAAYCQVPAQIRGIDEKTIGLDCRNFGSNQSFEFPLVLSRASTHLVIHVLRFIHDQHEAFRQIEERLAKWDAQRKEIFAALETFSVLCTGNLISKEIRVLVSAPGLFYLLSP